MNIFLTLASLFFIGSIFGWGFEVFFRKFFSDSNPDRRWINPGFLVGPYLPIYGFGVCGMYLLCSVSLDFISSEVVQTIVRMVMITVVMTGIEYVAGLIFMKGLHLKLWDYSRRLGNIQGIICPAFSLIWGIFGAFYYFVVHPRLIRGLFWLSEHLAYSFFVGLFFGVILIDLGYSLQIMVKIRNFAKENRIVVRYEEFKASIKRNREAAKKKAKFVFAFRTERPLREYLNRYLESVKERESKLPGKRKKK